MSPSLYFLLQHLVRLRWEELNSTERRNFANLAVDLMSEIANHCEEWALKSQTAALVAEVYSILLTCCSSNFVNYFINDSFMAVLINCSTHSTDS